MNASNKARETVLIVDDTPDNIMLLSGLLRDKYNTKIATNGATALQIANASPDLDLILLDVMMPSLDGYQTCRQLKANPLTADIPVIFLTARSQIEDEAMGLAAGAADYLAKPISPPILFARVATHLTLQNAHRQLRDQNRKLETLVAERTARLDLTQDAMIAAMASIARSREILQKGRAGQVDQEVEQALLEIEQRLAVLEARIGGAG